MSTLFIIVLYNQNNMMYNNIVNKNIFNCSEEFENKMLSTLSKLGAFCFYIQYNKMYIDNRICWIKDNASYHINWRGLVGTSSSSKRDRIKTNCYLFELAKQKSKIISLAISLVSLRWKNYELKNTN